MSIKATNVLNTRRTVKVKLAFEADGERRVEEVRVVYRGMSLKFAREFEGASDEDRQEVITQLTKIVVGLPDILGDDDQPIAPTADFFESLEIENLRTISDAIGNDINPPTKPSAS